MEDYRTIRGQPSENTKRKRAASFAQLSFADSEEKAVAFLEQVRAASRTARQAMSLYRLPRGRSAIPTTANRPKQRVRLPWRSCSTAD